MDKFVIFFENGNYVTINADYLKESDNYINFYNRIVDTQKDILVAQFTKSKVAGYSIYKNAEV